MTTWSDSAQRELDRQKGEALDRRAAASPHTRRPLRSLVEEVLADQIAKQCDELDAACERLKATLRAAREACRQFQAELGRDRNPPGGR